jgi:hypothetical protein
MKKNWKLRNKMRPGRVYRRQELEKFSTAVDRDLKALVENGEVRKLAGGLYSRPRENTFGFAPPSDKELVRAFLKTDDFLLTSYNYFTELGLGLTQLYNTAVVYNHKRSGDFTLGGRRFEFRLVPAYPRQLTKEFLLVDMLNNLSRLPDETTRVLQSLKSRLNDFDHEKMRKCLDRFGRPAARAMFEEAHA